MQRHVAVEPPVELTVTPDAKGLRLQPAKPLAADTVYRFTLLDRVR